MYNDGSLSLETLRNLRIIIISVLIGTVCFSVTGGSAFTWYLKALGASDFVLGSLMAMPFVIRLVQLVISYLLERTRKRRLFLCYIGVVSRLLWIPVALVPYFVPMALPALQLWTILILYAMIALTGIFVDSAFFSLAADVVPMPIRGRFFSIRAKLMMVVGILAGLLIGFLLDNVKGQNGLLGYTICFVMAGVFGAGDIVCFFFMRFPPMLGEDKPQERDSLLTMIRSVFANKPFMRLVVFWTCWSLSINIVAPFFNVYMLEYLHVSFTQIWLLCTLPANILSLLSLQRWGRAMDQYGYKTVLRICAFVGALLPLFWIFAGPGRFVVPILVLQLLSGLVWPAIDLTSQNTIMNTAPEKNRSMFAAIHAVISQLIGVALGFVVGGYLLDNVFTPLSQTIDATGFTYMGGFQVNQYHLAFIMASVLRLSVVLFLLPHAGFTSTATIREIASEVSGNAKKTLSRNYAMFKRQMLHYKNRRRLKR